MATIPGLNPAFTWTVTGTPTTETFVCGEPYVVDGGSGVELTAISPAPSGTGNTARNGSMVNPTGAYVHGFDGRARAGNTFGGYTLSAFWDYNDSRNVGLNLPYTLTSNKSLVSVKSKVDAESRYRVISDLAILTCIGSNPGSGNAFRPPFIGTTKPLHLKSSVDYGKLPMLTPPGNPTDGSMVNGIFNFFLTPSQSGEYGWYDVAETIGTAADSADATEVWRPSNHMHNYPADFAKELSRMIMYVMCDFGGAEQTYANRLIQYGIDLYAAFVLDPDRFCHGAGYGVGRMFPIMFAGYMLDDEDMLNVCSVSTGRTDGEFDTPVLPFQEIATIHSSPTAHKQYRRPIPYSSYPDGPPLYGDFWIAGGYTGGSPDNNCRRDPNGVYYGAGYDPPAPYETDPVIYADGGQYFNAVSASQVSVMLAIRLLGLQSYLGPAGKRAMDWADIYANDPGLWGGFNVYGFDYSGYTPGGSGPDDASYKYRCDLWGHGGTGNHFNYLMWQTYRYPGGRKLMGF